MDLNEHTMMFTLNGEILLDDSGSELAFKDFEVGDGKFLSEFGLLSGCLSNFFLILLEKFLKPNISSFQPKVMAQRQELPQGFYLGDPSAFWDYDIKIW